MLIVIKNSLKKTLKRFQFIDKIKTNNRDAKDEKRKFWGKRYNWQK